jgi:CRISPR-associated DxTHG motif protein
MSTRVADVLRQKQTAVQTTSPETSVFDAIAVMAEHGIGALAVTEGGRLAGILSERDYTRKVALKDRSSRTTQVREIMTWPVITVGPTTTVDECMRRMTTHGIRHLPVLEGDSLVGMISTKDVMRCIISEQDQLIHQLENYISGVA